MTAQTYKLVEGYIDCHHLGPVMVKGIAEPVHVYQVIGEPGVRTRIDVAFERGFTRFVARERELDQLRHCFELVKHGTGQAVSIIGDAGLGKSRLVHEFRQTLAGQNLTWLEGRCHSYNAAVAYLPIVEVLKQHFQINSSDSDELIIHKVQDGLEALSAELVSTAPYLLRLLSSMAGDGISEAMSPEAVKHHIFEALRLLMIEGAIQRPVVLTIEDVHWMDKATEEFLTFLLDHIAGSRVLLIFTYRSEFVATWARTSYHSLVNLTRLVQRESYRMLTALLGTPRVHDTVARLVLDRADGVPFFLEELVKALQESGAIEVDDNQWVLKDADTASQLPKSVEEVLMARIDRLPEKAKRVLQISAVIGREINAELLQEIAAEEERELTAHLRVLTAAELLYERRLASQTLYIFKHAFTQEAAYRSVLTPRRRELHRRVAVMLEALFPDRLEEHYGQLAYHFFEADTSDETGKAIDYAMRAGNRHLALLAYAEAARFFQMGLQALKRQVPLDEARCCSFLLGLGEAQQKASDLKEALITLQAAADIAKCLGLSANLVQAALLSEATTWDGQLPTASVVSLLQDALNTVGEDDSTLRARVLGSLARALRGVGGQSQAATYAWKGVEMARRINDPATLAFALMVVCSLPWRPEEVEQRLTYVSEALQLAEVLEDHYLLKHAHGLRMNYLLELGDIHALDGEIEAYNRQVETLRQPLYVYLMLGYQVMRNLLEGHFADAERLAQEALVIGQKVQAESAAGTFGVQMFTIRREQGRLKELAPVVRHFVEQNAAASTWRPGLALIYSELGLDQEARQAFEDLAQHDFADLPRDALWVACLTYLAEVCVFLGDSDRAAILYDLLLPYAKRTVVVGGDVVCHGAVSRYLGMLAATMTRWGEAVQHFEHALAMNQQMGAKPWLAHTQHAYAKMRLARNEPGDWAKATAMLEEALTTALQLDMRALEEHVIACMEQTTSPTPVLQEGLADLSQREIEVLRLIVSGKSNREIADLLFISLSTVASHVRHILAKTNTTNRTEAAAYAMLHGLSPQA
jgi:DNA-binding CsgD family transcriptional regulator/tetratricopeptide (TPR) repeat protein